MLTPGGSVTITNLDGSKSVDVTLEDGKNRLEVTGSVSVYAASLGSLYIVNALNAGSANLRVNGSVTPVVFTVPPDSTRSFFITELRFYGGGNGIKFEQFLAQNVVLTKGLLINIKENDVMTTMPLLKTTEDIKNKFSFGGADNFSIDIQSGGDQFVASFIPQGAIELKPVGTFVTDDYIKITVQDNLTSVASEFEFIVIGYLR